MSVYTSPTSRGQAQGMTAPRGRWQDWVNLILGIWLFISPWVYRSAVGNFGWDGWIMGVIVFVVALWAINSPAASGAEWINAIAGAWLFISPWALGFSHFAGGAWNNWIVGAVVFILAIWAGSMLRSPMNNPTGTPVNPS